MDTFDSHAAAKAAAGVSQHVVGFYLDEDMQERAYIVCNEWDSSEEIMRLVFEARNKRPMSPMEEGLIRFVEKQHGGEFATIRR